jgi:hypothetical protein
MAGIDVVFGVLALLVVAWSVYHIVRKVRDALTADPEARTLNTEIELTDEFTRTEAEVTFPDGDTETVVYDHRIDQDERIELGQYDERSWMVVQKSLHYSSGGTKIEPCGPPDDLKEMYSLANVRSIDVTETTEMEAAVTVSVKKSQTKRHDRWNTDHVSFDRHTNYDIEVREQ